jgi:hypothetical protein
MTDPILPMRRLPRVPRFPRKLGDDTWLRKKLEEARSPEHEQFRRDYLGVWTGKYENKGNTDGPDPKADAAV